MVLNSEHYGPQRSQELVLQGGRYVRNPYMEANIDAIKSLCQWQLSTTWPDNLPSPACLPLCFLFKPVGYFLLSSGSIASRQKVPPRRIHTLLCSTPARLPSFPAP